MACPRLHNDLRRGRLIRAALFASAVISSSVALADQAADIATAKRAVAKSLRDPGSAKFDEVRARSGAVCGQVNAKNGMGGYAGATLFVYETTSREAFVLDPASISTAGPIWAQRAIDTYERYCKNLPAAAQRPQNKLNPDGVN